MEHQSQLKEADILGSSKANKDAPAPAEPPAAKENTPKRRGKMPAKRIVLSDRSSSPEQPEQQPAKRQRRYHAITTDSDDESSAGLPATNQSSLLIHPSPILSKYFSLYFYFLICLDAKAQYLDYIIWQEKKRTTLQGIHDPRILPKPIPLEVPGNRLSETGSRRTLLPSRGAWQSAGNRSALAESKSSTIQMKEVVLKQLRLKRPRN
ncbi:hypothetical protein V6N12_061050 [Hibiscus sabdariffa]|uniref:Uncharacterized protein n=1 Tax=Hibiscus sabdariffa TaxID=183260 RepID=A0ABR2DVY4_9ROSI